MRNIYNDQLVYAQPELLTKLKNVWKDHQRNYGTTISTNHTNCGIKGIINVHCCMVKSFNRQNIMDSFKEVGFFPFDFKQIQKKM